MKRVLSRAEAVQQMLGHGAGKVDCRWGQYEFLNEFAVLRLLSKPTLSAVPVIKPA